MQLASANSIRFPRQHRAERLRRRCALRDDVYLKAFEDRRRSRSALCWRGNGGHLERDHETRFRVNVGRPNWSQMRLRARCSRLMTVPGGSDRATAISA
jgi:hypothetical protein